MNIYIVTVINDPTSSEIAYTLGAFSNIENAEAQIITFLGSRDATIEENCTYDWGKRFYINDNEIKMEFYIDIEKYELDAQYVYI